MWVVIGIEQPVKDDAGNRSERDDKGVPRPVELVPYEQFKDLEFDIDDMAEAKDRRLFEFIFEELAKQKVSSVTAAMDWESTWLLLASKYIKGVKHVKTGTILAENELKAFLTEDPDMHDVYAVLFTLKNQLNLSKAKKKSWKQRFALPTE